MGLGTGVRVGPGASVARARQVRLAGCAGGRHERACGSQPAGLGAGREGSGLGRSGSCWAAGLGKGKGGARREGVLGWVWVSCFGFGWVSFLLLLLFLFLFKLTQPNLFEFKIEFEFNSNTQTNKTMLQHDATTKLNL